MLRSVEKREREEVENVERQGECIEIPIALRQEWLLSIANITYWKNKANVSGSHIGR